MTIDRVKELEVTGTVTMELPTNETVRLIKGITRVSHTPEIVEGETSSTGKTIKVKHNGDLFQLDTEEILNGDTVIRDAMTFELYTPERFQSNQEANHAPGPQVGADEITDTSELPPATHQPQS